MNSERTRRSLALIGTTAFLVLAPGVVAGYVPCRITHWHTGRSSPLSPVPQAIGAILVLLGSASIVASFLRFAIQGLGTPAPPFPTRKLIISGMYQYVRNPMYVAVVAVILGQALAFGSLRLAVYAACVWLTMHLFVLLYEEPKLRRSFGEDYEMYLTSTPRWLPTIKPAKRNKP